MEQPRERHFFHCFQFQLEFRSVIFMEGGKPEDLEENSLSKSKTNKLNPHITMGPG